MLQQRPMVTGAAPPGCGRLHMPAVRSRLDLAAALDVSTTINGLAARLMRNCPVLGNFPLAFAARGHPGKIAAARQVRTTSLGIDEPDLRHPLAVHVLPVDLQLSPLDDLSVNASDAGGCCHPGRNLEVFAGDVVETKAVDFNSANLISLLPIIQKIIAIFYDLRA